MTDWWSYRPGDFLLFSAEVYGRLLERHNEAFWPWQMPLLAVLALACLVTLTRSRPAVARITLALFAGAWLLVTWAFLWRLYANINWAMDYVIPVFIVQALVLAALGAIAPGTRQLPPRRVPRLVGMALLFHGLCLHPLLSLTTPWPVTTAQTAAIFPDPLAIATLGLVLATTRGLRATVMMLIPALWCLFSGATLLLLDQWQGWLLLAAPVVATAARALHRAR